MALPRKNKFSKKLVGEMVVVQHKNGIIKEIAQEAGLTIKLSKMFMRGFVKVIFKYLSELKIVDIPELFRIGPIVREEHEKVKKTIKVPGVKFYDASPDQIDEKKILVPTKFQCDLRLKRKLQKFYVERNKQEELKAFKKMIKQDTQAGEERYGS